MSGFVTNNFHTPLKIILTTMLIAHIVTYSGYGQARWWQREQPLAGTGQVVNPSYTEKKRELERAFDQRARFIDQQRNAGGMTVAARDFAMSLDRQVSKLEHDLAQIPMFLNVEFPPREPLDVSPITIHVAPTASRETPSPEDMFIRAPPELRATEGPGVPSSRPSPFIGTWYSDDHDYRLNVSGEQGIYQCHVYSLQERRWITDNIKTDFTEGQITLRIYSDVQQDSLIEIWTITVVIDNGSILPVKVVNHRRDQEQSSVTYYYERVKQ